MHEARQAPTTDCVSSSIDSRLDTPATQRLHRLPGFPASQVPSFPAFRFPRQRKANQTKRNETLAYNKIGCESVPGNWDKNVIRAE